jgi:putative transposase
MLDYRRYRVPGGYYFFTVNWLERYQNDRLTRPIEIVREAVRQVRQVRPSHVDAGVVLPDHLQCVWTLPLGDDDFPTRWRLIKALFGYGMAAMGSPRPGTHARDAVPGR